VLSGCGDREIELALAASLFGRFALARFNESFFFKPIEARINAAGRWLFRRVIRKFPSLFQLLIGARGILALTN
jgi:hypothetical protein